MGLYSWFIGVIFLVHWGYIPGSLGLYSIMHSLMATSLGWRTHAVWTNRSYLNMLIWNLKPSEEDRLEGATNIEKANML